MWGRLGWAEVRGRYRRTVFGPFWAVVSLAIFIIIFSIVWARLWKVNVVEFLPYVSAGMITWTMLSTIITEGCATFTTAEGLIKTLRFPYTLLTCAVTWRNLILFFHNLVVYVGIAIFCGVPLTWATLLIIPGLVIVCVNGVWVATLLGMLCARFRDVPQLIAIFLQVLLFVTPIFWTYEQLTGRMSVALVNFNFLLHYLEVVRMPMLGKAPTIYSWIVVIAGTLIGWLFTLLVYSRFRRRIPYWL